MTTTTDPAAERALLRARLDKFQTVDAFIDGFHRFFARGRVLLPTRQPREVGSLVTLQLEIAGGTIVLLAEGVVDSVRGERDNRSPGMVIRFTHIEPPYRTTVERVLALRNERTGSFEAVLNQRADPTPPQADSGAPTPGPDNDRPTDAPDPAPAVGSETPTVRDAAPLSVGAPSPAAQAAPSPGWAAVPVAQGEGSLAGDDFDALVDSIDDSFDAIFSTASTRTTTPSPAVQMRPGLEDASGDDDEDEARPVPSKTVFGLRAFDPSQGLAALRQQAAQLDASPTDEAHESDEPSSSGGVRPGVSTPPGGAATSLTPVGGTLSVDPEPADEPMDLLAGFADNEAAADGPVASRTMMGIPALGAVPRPQRAEVTEGSEPALDINNASTPPLGDLDDASSSQPLGRIQFNRVSRNELDEKRAAAPEAPSLPSEPDPFDEDELPAERVKPRPMTAILQSLQEADEPLPSPDDALQRLASPTPAGTAALSDDRADSALDDLVSDAAPSAVAAASTPERASALPVSARDASTDISWNDKKPGLFARFFRWLRGLFGG